jgi:hypothetical protein
MRIPVKFLVFSTVLSGLTTQVLAATLALWGTNGELWTTSSRLPDFSFAG